MECVRINPSCFMTAKVQGFGLVPILKPRVGVYLILWQLQASTFLVATSNVENVVEQIFGFLLFFFRGQMRPMRCPCTL